MLDSICSVTEAATKISLEPVPLFSHREAVVGLSSPFYGDILSFRVTSVQPSSFLDWPDPTLCLLKVYY